MNVVPGSLSVLSICRSGPDRGQPKAAFVREQVDSLRELGVKVEYCLVERPGMSGYLRAHTEMKARLRRDSFDLVHAHFGLSGVIAVAQRQSPAIVTFHGSDVNMRRNRGISRLVSGRCAARIFVSSALAHRLGSPESQFTYVLPCGVNLDVFRPIARTEARAALKLPPAGRLVLFGGRFGRQVKNYALARSALDLLPDVTLIELRDFSRSQVALLLNAVDAVLLTSHAEGSPQIVKEALACECPVVSVPVGDVAQLIGGLIGCEIVQPSPDTIAAALNRVLRSTIRVQGRERAKSYDLRLTAKRLLDIYRSVLAHNSLPTGTARLNHPERRVTVV